MNTKLFFLLTLPFALISCANTVQFSISNPTDYDRDNEVVEIALTDLGLSLDESKNISVYNSNNEPVLSQLYDSNEDENADILLVYTSIPAQSTSLFHISANKSTDTSNISTFARFVPERTDDFTWENDKVAFRMYGPTAQQLVETGKKGGTLSSGVDCWLKRVDYPIIDKWYAKHVNGGSYHKDDGEGLDNYHVGSSRGCGGIGIYENDTLFTAKNYTGYKIFNNGPIRTNFKLERAPWDAAGKTIQDSKTISIELGDNLSKYEITTNASFITVGLTLHDKPGNITIDSIAGWASNWTNHEDSELGTAIVFNPEDYLGHRIIRSNKKDESHLLVNLKAHDNKVTYYSGFSWKKAGVYPSAITWNAYLNNFSKALKTKLEVQIL